MQATREAQAVPYMLPVGKKDNKRLNALGAVFNEYCLKWIEDSNIPPQARLCDAGCGNGNFVIEYKKRNPDSYCYGFDKDPNQIEQAKINAQEAGVEIEFASLDIMDLAALKIMMPGFFDVIHTRFVLTHIQDQARAALNLWDRLAPGGTLVMLEVSKEMGPNMETAPKCIQAFHKAAFHQSQLQKTPRDCAEKVFEILSSRAEKPIYSRKSVISDTQEKRSFYRRGIEVIAKLLDSKTGEEKERIAKALGYENGVEMVQEAREWENGDNRLEVYNVPFLRFRKGEDKN